MWSEPLNVGDLVTVEWGYGPEDSGWAVGRVVAGPLTETQEKRGVRFLLEYVEGVYIEEAVIGDTIRKVR